MLNPNYYCVIMAGGIGARFWPMSSSALPKQFLDIFGDGTTMIQKTFNRFVQICPPENIYIVTSKAYKQLVQEQLPLVSEDRILLEPYRRNTAPCIAYANYKIKTKNPNATIVVAPSDHLILKEDVFKDVITIFIPETEQDPVTGFVELFLYRAAFEHAVYKTHRVLTDTGSDPPVIAAITGSECQDCLVVCRHMILLGGIPFAGKTADMDRNTLSFLIEHFDPLGICVDFD